MSFDRELLARRKLQDEPASSDPSAALQRARMARAASQPRPWAQAFFEQAEHVGLPLATLNDIVAESATLEVAMATMTKRIAAGDGRAELRKPAQADAAARISAAHAKAHQPRRSATHH